MTSAAMAVRPTAALHRAEGVTLMQRTANVLFGSPSVRRAHGGAEASFVPRALRGAGWKRRVSGTAVFAVDRKGSEASEKLPRIWITEPVADASAAPERARGASSPAPASSDGRVFVGSYPNGTDRGGWRAFDLAGVYFAEALGLPGEEFRQRRIDCYRAAEILLLHAAQRGNIEAHCRLGIIYEGDLCEGDYWRGLLEGRALHSAKTPCCERAYLHYSFAAYHGQGEACWRLGDMVADGRGCEADAARAFALYRRAFDLESGSFDEDRASTGNAALRLARAFERGRGCEQSFRRARTWYRVAACSLRAAFDQGQWHFKRERIEARRGVDRMAQEIAGCY